MVSLTGLSITPHLNQFWDDMRLSTLLIDKEVAESPEAVSIKTKLNLPTSIVDDIGDIFKVISSSDDPVGKGKETLYLTKNRGAFIKKCPGTSRYICCGYKILHIGTFCTMDCSYCILQAYFHPPVLQYFVNQSEMMAELDILFSDPSVSRIGTGEFTDSMIWERWTDLSKTLVQKFSLQSHAVLELKTKTNAINRLNGLTHNRKTIVSWSLNTTKVIHSEERDTASLAARLKAASQCQAWGYPLAFHFDPIIIYDGCENDYRKVIKMLFSQVSPDNIVWISLGTFRFLPALKPIVEKRFPSSKIVYEEFITGLDGKMRYFKPLRMKIYHKIISWIREFAPDCCIYFCMEDEEVWEKCLGFTPSDYGSLSEMLDKSAVKHCGLESGQGKGI